MHKILHIVGNRPHFIKLAPLSRAMKEDSRFEQVIVHTGQHYDHMLSDHFIQSLNLDLPKYNLGIGSDSPLSQIGNAIIGLEKIFQKELPDMVLVYGDTNSTAAGAIAAAKGNFSLSHIEAGLREFDKNIPEEINKLITDSISDLHFSPTNTGIQNLQKEGKTNSAILTGDIGLDLIRQSEDKIVLAEKILTDHNLQPGKFVLLTCHRESNTSKKENLIEIFNALNKIKFPIFFPIHPRTQKYLDQYSLSNMIDGENWILCEPIGFYETQALIRNAKVCVTDSGGIIKESYFHKTPAIIVDKQTEWLETIDEGWNHLAGPSEVKILSIFNNLSIPVSYKASLGNGSACKIIIKHIIDFLEAFA